MARVNRILAAVACSVLLASQVPGVAATSNPTPVTDDTTATIWSQVHVWEFGALPAMFRFCTATYLGDHYWLTAAHCFKNHLAAYLEQADGERAEIQQRFIHPNHADLALIVTGEGITATPRKLATEPVHLGQTLTVRGWSWLQDYPSESTIKVTTTNTHTFSKGVDYWDQFIAEFVNPLPYPSVVGDSGAGAYSPVDGALYGVLSDTNGSGVGYADVATHRQWILDTMAQNPYGSPGAKAPEPVGSSLHKWRDGTWLKTTKDYSGSTGSTTGTGNPNGSSRSGSAGIGYLRVSDWIDRIYLFFRGLLSS